MLKTPSLPMILSTNAGIIFLSIAINFPWSMTSCFMSKLIFVWMWFHFRQKLFKWSGMIFRGKITFLTGWWIWASSACCVPSRYWKAKGNNYNKRNVTDTITTLFLILFFLLIKILLNVISCCHFSNRFSLPRANWIPLNMVQ